MLYTRDDARVRRLAWMASAFRAASAFWAASFALWASSLAFCACACASSRAFLGDTGSLLGTIGLLPGPALGSFFLPGFFRLTALCLGLLLPAESFSPAGFFFRLLRGLLCRLCFLLCRGSVPRRGTQGIILLPGVQQPAVPRFFHPVHGFSGAGSHPIAQSIAHSQAHHPLSAVQLGCLDEPALSLGRVLLHSLSPGIALTQQLRGLAEIAVCRIAQQVCRLGVLLPVQVLLRQQQAGLGMALFCRHGQVPGRVLTALLGRDGEEIGRRLILGLSVSLFCPQTPVRQRLLGDGVFRGGGFLRRRCQQRLGLLLSLLRRPAQPLVRFGAVGLGAVSVQIAKAQGVLYVRIILVCLQQIPKSLLPFLIHC